MNWKVIDAEHWLMMISYRILIWQSREHAALSSVTEALVRSSLALENDLTISIPAALHDKKLLVGRIFEESSKAYWSFSERNECDVQVLSELRVDCIELLDEGEGIWAQRAVVDVHLHSDDILGTANRHEREKNQKFHDWRCRSLRAENFKGPISSDPHKQLKWNWTFRLKK